MSGPSGEYGREFVRDACAQERLRPLDGLVAVVVDEQRARLFFAHHARVVAHDERHRRAVEQVPRRRDDVVVVGNDASVMAEDRTRALLVRGDDVSEFEGEKSGLGARIAEELAAVLAVD